MYVSKKRPKDDHIFAGLESVVVLRGKYKQKPHMCKIHINFLRFDQKYIYIASKLRKKLALSSSIVTCTNISFWKMETYPFFCPKIKFDLCYI